MTDLISDILLILALGLLAALICRKLGISPLVGYLLAGALIGPGLLGWVAEGNYEIEHLAELGVFLLLFSIGLEFSLEELASLGRPFLVGGSLQMLLVAIPVGLSVWLVGNNPQTAILIGFALAFSSTVLVFKALAEAGKSTTRTGRRAIGVLLFQDAALIPLLLLIPLLTQSGEGASWLDFLWLGLISFLFIGSIFVVRYLMRRWIIPGLATFRSPELVVLFTLVLLGGVSFAAYTVSLPPAIGAFAAGLILSNNRWTAQIDALVLPFRESFSAIFFVSLGLLFNLDVVLTQPVWISVIFLGLIATKVGAALVALRCTGLSWHASLALGLGLAHVGEFAFVVLLQGYEAQLIDRATYQQLVTIAFATLLLTPLLLKFGLRRSGGTPEEPEDTATSISPPLQSALVIGIGPIGRQVATNLETLGHEVCLVDQSPVNLYPFAQQGFRTIAGDATEESILKACHSSQVGLAVVCVPDDYTAVRIVNLIRKTNNSASIVVRCRYQAREKKLREAGADEVVNEEQLVALKMLQVLERCGLFPAQEKTGPVSNQ